MTTNETKITDAQLKAETIKRRMAKSKSAAPYYVKVTYRNQGDTQDCYARAEYQSEQEARQAASMVRKVPSSAWRVDVCHETSRILAAWDRIDGRWQKTI